MLGICRRSASVDDVNSRDSRDSALALTRRFRTSSDGRLFAASAPSERMVPEVPITRSMRRLEISARAATGLCADMAYEAPPVVIGDRIGRDEPFGEPDDAELEAPRDADSLGRADRDLGAAAADVHDDGRTLADVSRIGGGQVDQPRFLGSGDHLNPQPDGPTDGRNERRAVGGFAHGARGRGDDLVYAVRGGDPRELR